jgi:hypothetical protein
MLKLDVIYEWKLDGEIRNFGDALHEVLIPAKQHYEWYLDEKNMHFVLGSVIDNTVIKETLRQGYKPVFHGCGWRGEPLETHLVEKCEFIGVRGPNTQEELARHGVDTVVSLDPAYQLPHLFQKGPPNGLAMVIRHIKDPTETNPNTIFDLKADAIFRPKVEDRADILSFIEKVSGARFVLTGAMHAAIVAHAYGVPFALLNSAYIDCPPKWEDWLASIDYGSPVFVDNIIEGREWYNSVRKDSEREQ